MKRILGKAFAALVAVLVLGLVGAGQATAAPQLAQRSPVTSYVVPNVTGTHGTLTIVLRSTNTCNFFSVFVDNNPKLEYHGKATKLTYKNLRGLHHVEVVTYCGYERTYTIYDKTVNVGLPKLDRPVVTAKRVHVVKQGQTLWRVAVIAYGHKYSYREKAGHEWRKIAKANGIKGTKIRTGQVLVIP